MERRHEVFRGDLCLPSTYVLSARTTPAYGCNATQTSLH
ncbi:hypothetical protein CEXT_360831, partial [Caerostris extrusa]